MAIVQPEGFMTMKISNDTIGNRTRDLLACSWLGHCRVGVGYEEKRFRNTGLDKVSAKQAVGQERRNFTKI